MRTKIQYISNDDYNQVSLEVKGENREQLMYEFADYLESKSKINCSRCPAEYENTIHEYFASSEGTKAEFMREFRKHLKNFKNQLK